MLAAILLILTSGAVSSGDALRGGRLWDTWWRENGAPPPAGIAPFQQQTGPEAFRCVTCHGWSPAELGSVQNLTDILLSSEGPQGHGLREHGLTTEDADDILAYLTSGAVNPAPLLDDNGAFRGDAERGQALYQKGHRGAMPCVACHGPDGVWLNLGSQRAPEWIGTIADDHPTRFLHAIKFGKAGSIMPGWHALGDSSQAMADLGAYAQQMLPDAPDARQAKSNRSPAMSTAPFIELTRKLDTSTPQPIGNVVDAPPLIAHIAPVDLDADGRMDLVACDVGRGEVVWLRQKADGTFDESRLGEPLPAPVHAEPVDIDADGDLDLVIAVMTIMLPSTDRIGKVVVIEQTDPGVFRTRILLENIHRVTDVRAGDLDGDGDVDLAVSQFGYIEGEVQWLENLGEGIWEPHHLADRSGAIHGPVVDIDNDGDLDIVVLFSQEWETVQAFVNDGSGHFTPLVLHDVPDADFSSSGLAAGDVDGDGDIDFAWTNGDAFVSVGYRPLPTHGIQWLENLGGYQFQFHRIDQFDGAYSPVIADLDGDGRQDLAAVSLFADWESPGTPSLRWWRQETEGFAPQDLDTTTSHLVACAVADTNNDGRPDLIGGGMALYPPFDRIPRLVQWHNLGTSEAIGEGSQSFPASITDALDATSDPGTRGMIFHAAGEWAEADRAYAQAESSEANNARWPYYRGILAIATGRSDQALQHLSRAGAIETDYAPLHSRLGELHAGLGDFWSAEQAWQRAGDRPEALAGRARLALDRGLPDLAIELLEGNSNASAAPLLAQAHLMLANEANLEFHALDMGLQPDDPWLEEIYAHSVTADPLVTQAQIAMIAGDRDRQVRLLRQALVVQPDHVDTQVSLANALLHAQAELPELEEAMRLLNAAAEKAPDNPTVQTRRGWALSRLGRGDDAMLLWESILTHYPQHAPAILHLGQLHLQEGRSAMALEFLRRGIAIPRDTAFSGTFEGPQRAVWLFLLGDAAKAEGKTEEALDAWYQASRLVPTDSIPQFKIGNLLLSQKRFADAVPHLEFAVAANPAIARMHAALGYACLNLGRLDRATEVLAQAVSLQPRYALAWFHLGSAELANGNRAGAIAALSEAVRLRPDFARAKQLLERVLAGE